MRIVKSNNSKEGEVWCISKHLLAASMRLKEVGDKATVLKVNVDDNPELAQRFGIRGIPTMIFFKNGQASKTLVGVQPKDEIKKSLEELA